MQIVTVVFFLIFMEDYVEHKNGKKKQVYAPVLFGSQLSNASQLKMFTYCEEILAFFRFRILLPFYLGCRKSCDCFNQKQQSN